MIIKTNQSLRFFEMGANMITVGELIKELEKYDKDMVVIDADGNELSSITPEKITDIFGIIENCIVMR